MEKINITDLIIDTYNPRKISKKELNKLKRSLEEFGFVEPIVVNSNKDRKNVLIGGHQRVKAAKELKYVDVPVIYVDVTKEREKILNLALNKISGEWDEDKLADILLELQEEPDIDLSGFDEAEIDKIIEEQIGDIFDEELDKPPTKVKQRVNTGDLWQLGKHRLMCGDATSKEDVDNLMDGNKADMVFTDPPYGMTLNTDWSSAKSRRDFAEAKNTFSGKKYKQVIGDHEDFTPEIITTIFNNFDYCKEIFIWGWDYYPELIKDRLEGSYFVWDKRLEESADKMYGSCFELCWSKFKHKKDMVRVKWVGIFGTEKEFDHKRHHPTQKPTLLADWFITKFSKKDDLITDVFGGSGSTLIACELLKRKCYMMELDTHYCDVIIQRWEDLTKQQAVKLYPKE